ncbi:Hypothetical protein FKW44_002172 [Caligus rogercresseyi]|uniref:Uncharacterized protein n=1 Tax=Caligus rogercresseyi TaxID=217165 RepID=A0A7T8KJT5_CALRO|nr:Hypothetical protein FKW44_002172 [Caligus rogercresseyi]
MLHALDFTPSAPLLRDNASFLRSKMRFADHMTELQITSIIPKLDCEQITKNRLRNTQDDFELSLTDENDVQDMMPLIIFCHWSRT